MFVDQTQVKCIAGKGGNGSVSYRKERFIPKGGPDGGNGGIGGSILFEADENINSLDTFLSKRILKAENGMQGQGALKQGRSGKDLVVKVPIGTLIKDARGTLLADLTQHKETFLVVCGGRGGRGNASFRSSTHKTPNFATPGKLGEEKALHLELKLIADIGFVGFPNAGKSTLLNALCHTEVKCAPYPFTTLVPFISFIESDYKRLFIADIPGIIEGASNNRGLGLAFLKHIERCKTLCFILDLSGQDPIKDFRILEKEITNYNPKLLQKPFFIVLNKCDTKGAKKHIKTIKNAHLVDERFLFVISALKHLHLEDFKQALFSA
jgi:GTP-binding protein